MNSSYQQIKNHAHHLSACRKHLHRQRAINDLKDTVMSHADLIGRTVAHELGHGVFHLKHTFDNAYGITEASTDNLMDYRWETSLIKHQWDGIHDPGLVIGMFEKDEDGMMSVPYDGKDRQENIMAVLNTIKDAYQNKAVVDLSELAKQAYYNYGYRYAISHNITLFYKKQSITIMYKEKPQLKIMSNEWHRNNSSNSLFYWNKAYPNSDEYGITISGDIDIIERFIKNEYKREIVISDKVQYNSDLLRYEDMNGNELSMEEYMNIIHNESMILGRESEKLDFDKSGNIKGVVTSETSDILYLSGKFGLKKIATFGDYLTIASGLYNISQGSSPMEQMPFIGAFITLSSSQWDEMDEDADWATAQRSYKDMMVYINKYGNQRNMGFIYTTHDLFKDFEEIVYVISPEYKPTNNPYQITGREAHNINPQINYVYWGSLDSNGAMIIKGKFLYN